jgi:hypothetical protein
MTIEAFVRIMVSRAYFAVFTQQLVPTDKLGNPDEESHPVTVSDDGSEA